MLRDSKTFSLFISLKALSTREFGRLCMNFHKSAKHVQVVFLSHFDRNKKLNSSAGSFALRSRMLFN